jgi:hypothetical protein
MITTDTPKNMILGSGNLYYDTADIGATGKGGSFSVEQETRWPELGGARSPLAGTGKIISEIATLEIPLMELTAAKLAKYVPTLASASDASSEYSTQPDIGYIASTDHKTVIWQGETMDAKAVWIRLDQALPVGGLKADFSDTEETVYTVKFQSFGALASPKKRNWQVLFAKKS